MGCKILSCFFRFCFSMVLILIAIRGIHEQNDNKGFVSQNIRLLGEKLSLSNLLNNLRNFCGLFITLENYLLIFTATFLLFNSKLAKVSGTIAILIELILVHNPVFYGGEEYRIMASQYLAVLGGILAF